MPPINPKARPFDDSTRGSLHELVADVGELKASSDLGVNRLTLARALAGLPLREKTRRQIETRLTGAKAPAQASAP